MIKTAAQALAAVGTKPSFTLSSEIDCPACGRKITISIDTATFAQFPILDCLTTIIVCDDCGDFRHAFRESEDEIIRIIRWYRAKVQRVLSSRLDRETEDSKIADHQKAMDGELESRLRRLCRIVTRRAGITDVIGHVNLKAGLLSVFDTGLTYDGTQTRTISSYDDTGRRIREFASFHGVKIHNFWKRETPP